MNPLEQLKRLLGGGGAGQAGVRANTMINKRAMPRMKMALPKLPQNGQYAQYRNADGTGGGFGPNRPAPRFPQAPQYEDGSPLYEVNPNVNPNSRQINPMGFTGGAGLNPRYNQEALPQVLGGMPMPGRKRLRVR